MANLLILVSIIIFSVSVTQSAPKVKQDRGVSFTVNVSKSEQDQFEKKIGTPYTLQTMKDSAKFVKDTLGTYKTNVTKVRLFVENMDGVAKTIGDEIHVSVRNISKTEFTGIIFEKMTRVWELNGDGTAPDSVLSGIAYYVRLKAGYGAKGPKESPSWNKSSDVTARIFVFCERITNGFVKELNKEMKQRFDIGTVFSTVFQQTLDTMWYYYKQGGVPP